jgi:hypothetical protein
MVKNNFYPNESSANKICEPTSAIKTNAKAKRGSRKPDRVGNTIKVQSHAKICN